MRLAAGDPLDRCRRGRDRAFWTEFPRGLVARGWSVSSSPSLTRTPGLEAAIAKVWAAPGSAERSRPPRLPRLARKDQHGLLAALILSGLQRREPGAGARPALGSGRASRRAPREDRDAARGRRGRHPWPSTRSRPRTGASTGPLTARALQPRDRPAHRRRGNLSRRPLADPTRRDALH